MATDDGLLYLIKWNNLSYAHATWESSADLRDDAALKTYHDRVAAGHRAAKVTNKFFRSSAGKKGGKAGKGAKGGKKRGRPSKVSNEYLSGTRVVLDDLMATGDVMGMVNNDLLPEKVKGRDMKLRGYQAEGVQFMLYNWSQNRSSILADEMGLGKTIQTVTFIHVLQRHIQRKRALRHPVLVVVPLSCLRQWEREIAVWSHLRTIVWHGDAASRKMIRAHDWFLPDLWKTGETAPSTTSKSYDEKPFGFDIVLATYESCTGDQLTRMCLGQMEWGLIVVDEAHRLKNENSLLAKTLERFHCVGTRLLLTGTPIQNNIGELWALMHFLDPDVFGDKEAFMERHDEMDSMEALEALHDDLKSYMIRRVKEDVEKSIKPKVETLVECELTVFQKVYYKALFERNAAFLYKGVRKRDRQGLWNIQMHLRKCCNHPWLLSGVRDKHVGDHASLMSKADMKDKLVRGSGKMVLLDKLLDKMRADGQRVLIFSQMVRRTCACVWWEKARERARGGEESVRGREGRQGDRGREDLRVKRARIVSNMFHPLSAL